MSERPFQQYEIIALWPQRAHGEHRIGTLPNSWDTGITYTDVLGDFMKETGTEIAMLRTYWSDADPLPVVWCVYQLAMGEPSFIGNAILENAKPAQVAAAG